MSGHSVSLISHSGDMTCRLSSAFSQVQAVVSDWQNVDTILIPMTSPVLSNASRT